MMYAISGNFLNTLHNAVKAFFSDLGSGWLLFGSPADIVLMVLDVLVSSAAIYFVLKLMNDSRAWQLLKGMIFIILLTVLFNILGLQTINFVLSNSLSVLAIGFVVIFQPELRRALETVGRRSLRFFNTLAPEGDEANLGMHNLIEAIVVSCERMAAVKTGALMIIERKTKLGELVQGTAVVIDSAVSSTLLEQIFYKGSPLHDGAVLLRDERVYAARCHVPLSDTYHMRRDFGTRHRAAVGASEIGDAIAVVVSEERGSISLAVSGRLYPMENGDSLRVLLYKLLAPEAEKKVKKGLRGMFHNVVSEHQETTVDGVLIPEIKPNRPRRRNRFFLQLISLLMGISLWAYVQVTTNPLIERSLQNVPLQMTNTEALLEKGIDFQKSSTQNTINITIEVRQRYNDRITRENIIAQIDFSDLDLDAIKASFTDTTSHSVQNLSVKVRVDSLAGGAYKVQVKDPSHIMVFLRPLE